MRERYKMLLSAPLWVPLCALAMAINWLFERDTFDHYWRELKDILKFAWQN